jgi:hypothetical protein
MSDNRTAVDDERQQEIRRLRGEAFFADLAAASCAADGYEMMAEMHRNRSTAATVAAHRLESERG